jgi:hypothetical protein
MVVVWWMVFKAVTLHAPVVPAGQSTVNVLLKQTDIRNLFLEMNARDKWMDGWMRASHSSERKTHCVYPSDNGFVISTWKVLLPSTNVNGCVKSHAPVAAADALHPRR